MKVGVKELKELIQFLRKNDISTISTYLNGFWEDDEAKIRQRAKAVDEIDPDIVMIQVLNPIPGSPIYKKAVKENMIEIDNLSLYDLEHCVMPTKHLTRQQLGELTGWAFQSFYSKPGRVERILNGYSSPYVQDEVSILQEQRRQIRKGRRRRRGCDLANCAHGGPIEQPSSRRQSCAGHRREPRHRRRRRGSAGPGRRGGRHQLPSKQRSRGKRPAPSRRCRRPRHDFSSRRDAKRMQVETMVTAASDKLGAIDVLVNNAYFPFEVGALHDLSWDNFHRAVDHELSAFFHCARACLPAMKEKKAGRIIVVSTRLAQQPLPRMGAYAAAKSALESMANTMAIELGPVGHRRQRRHAGVHADRCVDDHAGGLSRAGQRNAAAEKASLSRGCRRRHRVSWPAMRRACSPAAIYLITGGSHLQL